MKNTVGALLIAFLFIGVGSAAGAMPAPSPNDVWIDNVAQHAAPPAPSGLKIICTEASGAYGSSCPIFRYKDRITWIFTDAKDKSEFGLVTYDAHGTIVKNVRVKGSRYVWDAMSSNRTKRLVIYGQGKGIVYATWADIGAQ